MTFQNLCLHAMSFYAENGTVTVLPPSGTVARVSCTPGGLVQGFGEFTVFAPDTLGEVENLPEPQEGVVFVVSALVGAALSPERKALKDVVVPGTGPKDKPVRNEQGQVVGVTCFKLA